MSRARIPKDKQYHIIAMLIGTLAVALTAKSITLAVILAVTIGFAKETFDAAFGTTGFSWPDMAANTVGICIAIIIYMTIQAGGKQT